MTDTKKVDDACYVQSFEQTFGIDIVNEEWAALKNITDWDTSEEIMERAMGRRPIRSEYESMITNWNLGIEFVGIEIKGDDVVRDLGANNVFRHYLEDDRIMDILNG